MGNISEHVRLIGESIHSSFLSAQHRFFFPVLSFLVSVLFWRLKLMNVTTHFGSVR